MRKAAKQRHTAERAGTEAIKAAGGDELEILPRGRAELCPKSGERSGRHVVRHPDGGWSRASRAQAD